MPVKLGNAELQAAREYHGSSGGPTDVDIRMAFLQGILWERERVAGLHRAKAEALRQAVEDDIGPPLEES